jgi:hypothetical protein
MESMSDPEPVDLSLLDPAREPERWARILAQTGMRVDAVLQERGQPADVLTVMAGWARPVLAAAAAVLLLLGTALVSGGNELRQPRVSEARGLAALSAGYADGRLPTGAELSAALGGKRYR